MAITTRQTSLLVAEDWTKVYQTFRNADFQSYDYETLRKTMVDYLRIYYPEDFNDFVESSEFIALIDIIAFLGQSLAFRGDLNARENYIDTAERRDSVLKLASLISYVPKRCTPASGFLKIDSVSTTEIVFDSNGTNLSGIVINWADSGNDNWLEQFTAILNATLNSNQQIGKPSNSQIIAGVQSDEYQINLVPSVVAAYGFSSSVEGNSMDFEAVSPSSMGESYIYEVAPRPNSAFNLLYKNDNLGNGSANTGFFLYFKQGILKTLDINFTESIPNRVFSVNTNNINNTDIWLFSIDANGNVDTEWKKVPAVANTNVVYSKSTNKNIFQIKSRANDQIDLIFGDGAFANIPQGRFRLYYRVSNGLQYKITPDEMQGIVVSINYVSRLGRIETLAIRCSLQYTVANAATRETLNEVKQKAPQQYYTQDRMITGEDYNILPYTLYNNVIKVKAVNRTSSGVSRYLDVIDTTGKYSSTNIFAEDGIIYRNQFERNFDFTFNTRSELLRIVNNEVKPLTKTKEMQQFYYAFFDNLAVSETNWHITSEIGNGCTGFFYDESGSDAAYTQGIDPLLAVGTFAGDNKKYIKQGAIIKFSPGTGKYFDAQNRIKSGIPTKTNEKFYIYAAVQKVVGDGINGGLGNLTTGDGPITLNQIVPEGAIVDKVFPVLNTEITNTEINSIVSNIQAYEEFGLRYDYTASSWKVILPADINASGSFNLTNSGNTSGQSLDSSWLIKFTAVGETYVVTYRGLEYIFESVRETNFYFDNTVKIYDPKTGVTINDHVKLLKTNSLPDSADPLMLDYTWFIYDNIIETDGYESPNKVKITFPDSDYDGVPDNPEIFDIIVDPTVNTKQKYVFFQETVGYDNFLVQTHVDNDLVNTEYDTVRDLENVKTLFRNGQLFYLSLSDKFYQLTVDSAEVYTISEVSGYSANIGRQDLFFQYKHNSPNYRRIDPSPNNIIDLYILTRQYSQEYTLWIQDSTNTVPQPIAPTAESLRLEFSQLDNYKAVSDTLIFNPAKFKPLFGPKADASLRATFKVVKNPNVVISDNDIKTSVIAAINEYFDINNWEFGETFYFSELSAYLHNSLVPNIASVIIVPAGQNNIFGSLMQINSEYNEILVSAATVDNVQIISAITAAQINQISMA